MTIAKFLEFSPDWRRPSREPSREFYNRILPDGTRLVPKSLLANIRRRQELIRLGTENEEFARDLWIMCKRDILFFVNMFLWLKEPRPSASEKYRVFPWITWPVQDWWITEADESFGVENVISPKTRGVGVTYKKMAVFYHRFVFFDDVDMGLSSRNEEKVDAPSDPSSMFAKLDLFNRFIPGFLLRKSDYVRAPLRMLNLRNRSTIIGYPSTKDLNRGGRNTAFGNDELGAYPRGADQKAMDSLREVTDSQFIVSTYSEDDTKVFNQIALDESFPGKRLTVRWYDCPPMRAGAYTTDEQGRLKIVDETYEFPPEYPFKIDPRKVNKLRSPWYDRKTAGMKAQAIAREYDCDREGGVRKAFDKQQILRLKEVHAVPRIARGKIGFDPEEFTPTWYADDGGPLSLWFEPKGGRPPEDDAYSLGVDIAAGSGASNSVIQVFSRTTGRQVAEYVTAFDSPSKLAGIAKALGRWFGGEEEEAYLVFEANGPVGSQFRDELRRIGYANAHRRVVRDEKVDRRTKKLGFWMPPSEGAGGVLTELIEACVRGDATIVSGDCYDEFGQYAWKGGKIVHTGAESDADESEASATHGDRAVAAALAWFGCRQRPRAGSVATPKEPDFDSPEWLDRYFDELDAAEESDGAFVFG